MEDSPKLPFHNWPSQNEYTKLRANFIKTNQYQFDSYFEKYPELFSDLNLAQRKRFRQALTIFFFGVHMAYQHYGGKINRYALNLDSSNDSRYDFVAFEDSNNEFFVKISHLKELIQEPLEVRTYSGGGGIHRTIPAEDLIELSGVEEAAHLIFYNEKGHLGKPEIANAPEDIRYFTKEMEERALIWKISYARQYMPQYVDDLTETLNKVRDYKRSQHSSQ